MGSRSNNRGPDSRFKTDSDISFASAAQERPLQRWDEGEADSVPADDLANMSLEAGNNGGRGWDQFAANKEKFGIVPTYDERLYTTEVDRQHPDFADREQRARRIAKEIESQGHNGNAHLAEERGLKFDDSGLDEEDKYSGVARAKAQQTQQEFAAKEAEKAMGSPGYLQKQEKADRLEDAQQFNQKFGNAKTSKALKSPLSNENEDATSRRASVETSMDNSANSSKEPNAKSKKKFNFAASAARASSFTSSVSPSPRPSFKPLSVPSPGAVHPPPRMMPGSGMPAILAMPGGPPPPFAFTPPSAGMHSMMPPPGVIPPPGIMGFQFSGASPYGSSSSPDSSKAVSHVSSAIDLSTIEPVNSAFDFIKNAKSEKLPPIFATPPTWSSTGHVSYVDQFPAATPTPRVPAFLAPMSFVFPPQF